MNEHRDQREAVEKRAMERGRVGDIKGEIVTDRIGVRIIVENVESAAVADEAITWEELDEGAGDLLIRRFDALVADVLKA